MLKRPSSRCLREFESLVDSYIKQLDKLDKDVAELLESSPQRAMSLDAYPADTQLKILEKRNETLSIGYALSVSITDLTQNFRIAPSKLLELLLRVITRFLSLLTKYVGVFKIDSIEITISMTPSIAVKVACQ